MKTTIALISLVLVALVPGTAPLAQTGGLDADSRGVPVSPSPAEVDNALELLGDSRDRFVVEAFRGDTLGMAQEYAVRTSALEMLSWAIESPEIIDELPWPRRTRWLEVSLQERRNDWARALLEATGGDLPDEGSPSRGPASLAVGLTALRLLEFDPEDDAAFLAGPPRVSLQEVAEGAFLAAAGEEFTLQDEAFYRLWELAEGEGDTLVSLAWADSLVLRHPRSLRTPLVRLTRARAKLNAGMLADAIEEARLAIDHQETAGLRWLLVEGYQALEFHGETRRELVRLISGFGSDPLAPLAWSRLQTLMAAEPKQFIPLIEQVRLAKSMFPNQGSGAIEWVRAISETDTLSHQVRDEAKTLLARYFYRAKRYPEAESLLEELLEAKRAKLREEGELILARIYRNTGRLEKMERRYRSVMDQGGVEAPRAMWELGREFESEGKWVLADEVYTEGLKRFTGTARYREVLFRRGFTRFRQDLFEEAGQDFRAAFRASSTESQEEQAVYWLAHALSIQGDEAAAIEAAKAGMTRTEPAGAYGVLLRFRFGSVEDAPDPHEPDPTTAEMLFELLDTSSWPGPIHQHFLRGLLLAELGDLDAARKEWERAYSLGPRDAAVVQGLALAAAGFNVYPQGVRWARRARELLPSTHPMREGFERLSLPPAYYGDVVREAERNRVDPFSIWALMRQESMYDPVAVSRVGALGLMQIMPYTLNRITSEAGLPPMEPDALFRPQVNITLGIRFYGDRLREFSDQLLPTLASYNAGENKSWQWLERADGDHQEVFLECIGYPETYNYVRRILWLKWLYRAYYGGGNRSSSAGSEAR